MLNSECAVCGKFENLACPIIIMESRSEPRKPLRLLVLSCYRTASNLFLKLFERHPSVAISSHLFHSAFMFGPERCFEYNTKQGNDVIETRRDHTYRDRYEKVLEFIADTEFKKQIPFVKEHIFALLSFRVLASKTPNSKLAGISEPTLVEGDAPRSPQGDQVFILPDSFLATLAPVILIRHPARTVPSLYRGCKTIFGFDMSDEEFGILLSPGWPRLVYDFWAKFYSGNDDAKWPIVIDMDELIRDPKNLVARFCDRIGIDEAGVQYEWEAMSNDQFAAQLPYKQHFFATVQKSREITRDEATLNEPVLDDEEKRWARLYGDDVAATMRRLVDEAMEDYEYLRARRL